MPQLRFHGVKKEQIKKFSKDLVDELATLIGCPRDHFVLEAIGSNYIFDGEEIEGYPFIEFAWFDRGLEVQDSAAQIVTKHIKSVGYHEVEVAFMVYETRKYYENGQHY
ncbi:DUF1904 domain-containing protein [Alkalicella caledoniensis]|uniref:DUF1904 domain-containing protein n=1 Tax=Alkalicella caledoniensis TaxID=2731377 RepID=A0A7G9W8T0_ALKCA|nr:DUF1904 family protein [Alkalicella caledoniensis]QNO15092.1 DUF1904 domain-containing protein [Alkalicella caledoniensis]